jgi:Icc-related predicted phosphoesterase
MKIHVLSDLHLEFGPCRIPPVDCDVTVLAGDVHLGRKALPMLEELCSQRPVVYVLGNHEFYRNEFDATLDFWNSCSLENLTFLENKAAIVNNTRFVGATLWTSMGNGDKKTMDLARYCMNDYVVVARGKSELTPEDTIERFDQSKAFIDRELRLPFDGTTVVVTHHLPSYKSVAPQFEGDPLNPCFASDLDALIGKHQPPIWIHGHTHASFDYHSGNTRVVCNPRGYAGQEMNPDFKAGLVLET